MALPNGGIHPCFSRMEHAARIQQEVTQGMLLGVSEMALQAKALAANLMTRVQSLGPMWQK